ncbi:tyrosine-type recombinase/integrase [Dyella kyungheensis]|uniref:Site-specific integrase n=1 Tax=Dyella kyungheensis TaxID=1242174 RepID=A0ABS2JL37_9GAMM|nr:site-specific integrase [Dyella kyungheensis]MBM7119751.1 site-specific integrase [Dyella kyungheensis]
MATYRRRGRYSWEAQVRRRGWPSQTKTFDTKAEAEAWAAMIESEMNRGVWLDRSEAESTTLGALLDRYEAEVVPALKGAIRERSILHLWRQTPLAKRTVATIRSGDVAQQRDAWLTNGLAPATVLRRLARLSHLFNTARKEWGMESLSNPVELVRKPTPNNARTRRVAAHPANNRHRGHTKDELSRITEASESQMLPTIITLAVETAMRRGEIASLRWEHIDLVRRVAHLPETKNGNSRDVPLSQAALEAFIALLPGHEGTTRRRKTPAVPPSLRGPVFAVHPDGITQAFERALQRARKAYETECMERGHDPKPSFLKDLRFHDLRHEATSRLASRFQLHELAKITGHRDTRMLLRYYHPDAGELAKRMG